MVSTPSPSLLIEMPGNKDYLNTWQPPLTQIITQFDYAIAGTTFISTTGGTVILTDTNYVADQARGQCLFITGTLVSNATIQVPNRSKTYLIINNTTGVFTLTIATSAPVNTQAVTQGAAQFVYIDGSSNVYPASAAATLSTGVASISGTNGQVLVGVTGSSAVMATVSGDGTITNSGALTITKTNGMAFAASATTNALNASNITSGTLAAAQGGAGTANGILKGNGAGTVSAAVSGTDYAPATSGSAILKGNGSGGFSSALSGTDYISPGTTATFTVGYTITPYSGGTVSSGTYTPAAANGNYQYYTNNGAHTLANPAADSAIDILVTNGASAGTITFSGFTVGSSTGDALTTTNTQKFIISVRRINAISTYTIKALQ